MNTSSLLLILIIFSLVIFFKSKYAKGLLGEGVVNIAIKARLDKSRYHLIKNITLPIMESTTQIDHVVISEYGIFVIETKNMKGWIFGSEHKPMWTQKIYKHTNKFQNPLRQNYKHVKALENTLGIEANKIYSIVVFVGDSTFKTEMPANVSQGGEFISYIKSKTDKIITSNEVERIISKISSKRLKPSFKTDKEHVANLKRAPILNDSMICPRCSSELVERESKRGSKIGNKFVGCSAFPKCRYIKK